MGVMSKTIRNNLLIAMVPLLIGEALFIYPVFFNGFPLWQLLIPISLLTLFPVAAVHDALKYGSYGELLGLIAFDIMFLWIMAFSIVRSHRVIGAVCFSVFILLSIGLFGGSS